MTLSIALFAHHYKLGHHIVVMHTHTHATVTMHDMPMHEYGLGMIGGSEGSVGWMGGWWFVGWLVGWSVMIS